MPPCLPNCFCDECLPLRLRSLESSTHEQQRVFWERVGRASTRSALQLRRLSQQPPPPQPPHQPPRPSSPPPLQRTSVALASLLTPAGADEAQSTALAMKIRRDNLFHLSPIVSSYVNNLQDAFSIIERRLQTAGPRRQECMYEAMEGVVGFYEGLIRNPNVPPPPPPPPVDIEHLPTQNYVASASSDTDRKECTICQEDFQDGEEIIQLPCSHVFHNSDECFKGWAHQGNTECANCRQSFVKA